MKAIYKPFSIVIGLLSAFASKKIFDVIWQKIDDEEMPKGTHRDVPFPKILAASALQGVVFKGTRAAVDRYGARGFYHLTGFWPGERRPAPYEE